MGHPELLNSDFVVCVQHSNYLIQHPNNVVLTPAPIHQWHSMVLLDHPLHRSTCSWAKDDQGTRIGAQGLGGRRSGEEPAGKALFLIWTGQGDRVKQLTLKNNPLISSVH